VNLFLEATSYKSLVLLISTQRVAGPNTLTQSRRGYENPSTNSITNMAYEIFMTMNTSLSNSEIYMPPDYRSS